MKINFLNFRNQLLLWLSVLLLSTSSYAQNVQDPHIDMGCGLSATYLQSLMATPPKAFVHEYDPSAQVTCGKFRIYYWDLQPGYPAVGFNDPVLGAARRNTLCAVLTYIQSVFDFSNIPSSSPILLEVNASLVPVVNPAQPTDRFLAFAGPIFGNATGIRGGYINDYITTGNNPAGADEFHANMTVNFHMAGNTTINWHDDYTQPIPTGCRYDLFSVLLHEIGHTLGFLSTAADANGDLVPGSVLGGNRFTKLDYQLHRTDDVSSPFGFQKLIQGLPTAPFLNPALSGAVDGNDYWLNGQQAPWNYPVYSGQQDAGNSQNFMPMSVLSHMDEQFMAYKFKARKSPGYAEDYVMGPFANQGTLRRQFAKEEIRFFMDMGYPLNPSFNATNLLNRPPFSSKVAGYSGFHSSYFADMIVPTDYTLVNNTGASLTINLWQDGTISDPDLDIVRIDTNTIFNIRGCSDEGNNHDQLTVSTDRRSITFTPKPNFFGRVQFGFRMTDDKDLGAWHMYTIDVSAGTAVVFNPGSNLVLNGNFENGMEVKRLGADLTKPNSSRINNLREGFLMGVHYSESHPYNYFSNFWAPFGAGDFIRDAHAYCDIQPELFGAYTASFPNFNPTNLITNPDNAPNGGDRYTSLRWNHNFFTLGAPVESCKRYVLKMDYMVRQDLITWGGLSSYPLTIAFTNTAAVDTINPWSFLPETFSVVHDIPAAPAGTWTHYETPFTYCAATPATFLNLRFPNVSGMMMDNLELVEVTTPPLPLTATVSGPTTAICSGASANLSASVTNALCNVTYEWSTGETTASITVNPTSTQTYSVHVSDGCNDTYTNFTVQVTAPPVMHPLSNITQCEGSLVTVPVFVSVPTATSFSWTNTNTAIGLGASGTGNISFTGQNPNLVNNVSVSGTITVTPVIGSCQGAPNIFTITIKPKPVAIVPQNIGVCPGVQVPASAFSGLPSATTFSWTNNNTGIGLGASGSGNTPAFTAVNATGSPAVATITLTPTLSGCNGDAVTYTITVNPASSISITPASSTIPVGGSVNLTATGGSTYTWTPTEGLSCTNCPNPVASPQNSTTYMVTGANAYGCSNVAYAMVSLPIVSCSSCTYTLAPSGTLSSNPTANRVYCVNNSIQVTGNVTISNSELKMASNTQIVVMPGATLSLAGCHLYSCGNMWQGIQVLPGGKVYSNDQLLTIWPSVTTKSTLIEDAIIAIDVNPNSNVTADLLTISNTTFNRNTTGIRISDYSQTVSTYPFNISKSVFTCRNIPFVANSNAWPQTPAVAAANPSATPLTNQVINNAAYLQTGTASFLKAPSVPNTKSKYGMQLINVGTTANASSTAPAYNELKLGNAAYVNIFDNQQTCVEAISSNLQSVNNIFQNTGVKGIGIAAKAADGKNNRLQVVSVLATVGSNKFVDCGTAIRSQNYFEHNIRFCDVRSSQVSGTSSRYGFNIRTNRYRVCDVVSNSIYNVADGITFEAINGAYNITGTAYSNGQYAGRVNVDFNTIRPHLSGSAVTTQYVNNAVYLVNSGVHTERANNLSPTISTNMNTILANRPVYYANWIRENCQIQNNTITVLFNPNFFTGATYYGISVNHSQWSSTNGSFIKNNSVGGFYTPTANSNPSGDPVLTGIVGSSIVGFSVTCNNTFNTTRGIGFTGGNPNTVFRNNKMQAHRYGFFLDQNGSIGQQGSAPVGSTPAITADNQWIGTWLAGNFKTTTMNGSIGQNSVMHTRLAAPYNPDGSTIAIFAPATGVYNTSVLPRTLWNYNIAPPIFDLSCIQFITFPGIKKNLELIVGDSIEYSDDLNELGEKMRYINKNLVYLALKVDSVLIDSSAVLQDFYNSSLLTARETIHKIQKDMSRGNLLEATLSNLLFNPENNIEENYKRYHEIYIKYQQGICGVEDSTNLRGISEKCPFNDGSVVYQARALYNLIFDTREAFPDLCPEEVRAKSMMITNETLEQKDGILLYPNPAKDEVFIVLDQPELLKIEITVMDANGKIVFANSFLDVRDGLATFTLDVDNGIYFVNVINPITNESSVEKLVIHK